MLLGFTPGLKQLRRRASAEYRFAYLAYKCALASAEPSIAEAWADTALDVLMRHEAGNPAIKHDFKQFSPNALGEIQIIWTNHAATLERLLGNAWSVSKQSIALIGNEAVLDGR